MDGQLREAGDLIASVQAGSFDRRTKAEVFGKSQSSSTTKREIIMPNSVHLHRVLAARPDKVYRAFLEPDALAKWLPPQRLRLHSA